jgi:hypothetical protein
MKLLAVAVCLVSLGVPALATAQYSTGPDFPLPAIRSEPISEVFNAQWFNYLANVNDADKELNHDLRRASDREDIADAWEEYAVELVDADKDYVKAMRKRGYRVGRVSVLASRN